MLKEDFVDIIKTAMHVMSAEALYDVVCNGADPEEKSDKLNAQLHALFMVYTVSDIGDDAVREDLRGYARAIMYHYEKDSRPEG